MNTRRSKKTGRFTGKVITRTRAVDEARKYYQKHKKSLDKYISTVEGKTKEDIFTDVFKYGISGGGMIDVLSESKSQRSFKDKLEKAVAYIKGYNLTAWEAKKLAVNGENYSLNGKRLSDKRVLSMKNFDLNQEEIQHYWDNGLDQRDPNFFTVEGYFEIANSDIVIARVYQTNEFADGSPTQRWEFFSKAEIGL